MAVLIASPLFILAYKTVWFFNRNNKTDPEKYDCLNLDLTHGWIKSLARVQGLLFWFTLKGIECKECKL